jgi:hypothetical protein
MDMPMLFAVEETQDGSTLQTRGLRALGQREILLVKPDAQLEEAAKGLLRMLGEYSLTHEKPIRPGDKVRHGYWAVVLQEGVEGGLEVFEPTADGAGLVRGVTLCLNYWVQQSEVCRELDTEFMPPYLDQKVASSVGVLEGELPVSGVRYEAPSHMSGWYLTTESYSGDVRDLRVDHLYHLTSRRPDVVRFLALPPGHRFEISVRGGRAYFDPEVLKG